MGNSKEVKITRGSGWVSDVIGDAYKNWHLRNENSTREIATRVYIGAPTGSGKTHFILHQLADFAAEKERNILYLSNRSALEAQVKQSFCEGASWLRSEDTKDLDHKRHFPLRGCASYITITNYQALLNNASCLKEDFLHDYNYIVFDEAHFFLEDSLFNTFTWKCLHELLNYFYCSVFIFMSATIEDFMEVMQQLPSDYEHYQRGVGIAQEALMHFDNQAYFLESKPEVYHPYVFTDNQEVFQMVSQNAFRDKWLFFVSSKQQGSILKNNLDTLRDGLITDCKFRIKIRREKLLSQDSEKSIQTDAQIKELEQEMKRLERCKIKFISAESKNTATWRSIVNESKFPENVLITTKVLDNGVNIKDPEVKHVVLPFCDRVEFMQMLGRRRISDGEQIHVYVNYPTKKHLSTQLKRYRAMYDALWKVLDLNQQLASLLQAEKKIIYDVDKVLDTSTMTTKKQKQLYASRLDAFNREMSRLLKRYWEEKEHVRNLLYINDRRNLCVNPLAERKLAHLIEFYTDLLQNYQSNLDNYVNKQLENWLGNQACSKPIWLQNRLYGTLEEFLRQHLEVPIPSEDQTDFYNQYIQIFNIWCVEIFAEKPDKLREWRGVKKSRDRKKGIICKSLQIAEMPYTLVKRKNSWILVEDRKEK